MGELCKLDKENAKDEPTLLLIDCDDNGAYYRPEHSITEAGIRSLLEDYRAKKLTRLQFGQGAANRGLGAAGALPYRVRSRGIFWLRPSVHSFRIGLSWVWATWLRKQHPHRKGRLAQR